MKTPVSPPESPAQPAAAPLLIDPETIDHPILGDLLNYWRRKCDGRAMPRRSEIVPSQVPRILPFMIITDVMPDFADFRYRLIGSMVTRYFNGDYTGKTVREAFATWPDGIADSALQVHRACAETRKVVYTSTPDGWVGSFEAFGSLYLPLSDDGETCNMVLNGFAFNRDAVLLSRAIQEQSR